MRRCAPSRVLVAPRRKERRLHRNQEADNTGEEHASIVNFVQCAEVRATSALLFKEVVPAGSVSD